jgi:hypothetical protein
MAQDMPIFEILERGESHKGSNIFQKLWTYHTYLMAEWKKVSPEKNIKSKNSSNTKSTANSTN